MSKLVKSGMLISLSVFLLWSVWQVPKYQVGHINGINKVTPDRKAELEDKTRQTLIQFLGGAFFFATIYFTWQSLLNAREGQVTERFTKAIEHLGSDSLGKRLGGIYALERIARDSAKDHWTVMEVLTAYVRQNAPYREFNPYDRESNDPDDEHVDQPADIHAILTVLGRRNTQHPEQGSLDISGTNLSGAKFKDANLDKAHLNRTDLYHADLTRASLRESCLVGAELFRAYLRGADLSGTDLGSADLREADLTGAKNLTQYQLNEAFTDKSTRVDPPLEVGKRITHYEDTDESTE